MSAQEQAQVQGTEEKKTIHPAEVERQFTRTLDSAQDAFRLLMDQFEREHLQRGQLVEAIENLRKMVSDRDNKIELLEEEINTLKDAEGIESK